MAHVPDSTMRQIQALHPDIQYAAFYLIWAARTSGYALQITSGLRSRAEQAALVRSGASQTRRSHHVIGQAFDVDIHGLGRDDVPLWFWELLGPFAESLGFRWGGRWSVPADYGHFENPYVVA